jgi:hypothetical protein
MLNKGLPAYTAAPSPGNAGQRHLHITPMTARCADKGLASINTP